jgi:hypothetical protein
VFQRAQRVQRPSAAGTKEGRNADHEPDGKYRWRRMGEPPAQNKAEWPDAEHQVRGPPMAAIEHDDGDEQTALENRQREID